MLLTKEVEVTIRGNIQYYENLGYEIPKYIDSQKRLKVKNGTKIKVKVDDLPKTSQTKVKVLCDYCLENGIETIVEKTYCEYLKSKERIIDKDMCQNCWTKKIKESNLKKYGVESTNSLCLVKQKKRESLCYSQEFVNSVFQERGLILLDDYVNSNLPLQYICQEHIYKGIQKNTFAHILSGQGCRYCGRESVSGENHYNWNGGVTTLNIYLRDKLRDWVKKSLEDSNYTCEISGIKGDTLNVHHKDSFSVMMYEALSELNLECKKVDLYTKDELYLITQNILNKHTENGAVLAKPIHKLFHKIYGTYDNTKEQYEEFKYRYYNYELDYLLRDKYKYQNIKGTVI